MRSFKFVVVLLLCSIPAIAQTADPGPRQPFSDEQRRAAPKTIADVADKALDLVSNAVAQISATIQNVAPEIWRIMIRQQYANAVGYVMFPLGLLAVFYVFRDQLAKRWQPTTDDGRGVKTAFVETIPIIIMVLSGIGFAWGLTRALQIFINPEYYAVRDLIRILLGSPGV